MSEPLTPALAAALGALQGVAEFLPISSSGHLALAELLLGVDPEAVGHSFNIVVHAGTLLAVLLHYRRDLLALVRAGLLLRPSERDLSAMAAGAGPNRPAPEDTLSARPTDAPRALLLALVVGTLPLAAALAPPVEALVLAAEHAPRVVGAGFLVTAAALSFAHLRSRAGLGRSIPGLPHALLIGLAQLVAILPGISRSGATMAAAMALGVGRVPAARFSFLLSVPAILGASTKEALDLLQDGAPAALDPTSFLLGFAVSFAVGALTLRLLVHLLGRIGLLPFVPYLVLLALTVFALT